MDTCRKPCFALFWSICYLASSLLFGSVAASEKRATEKYIDASAVRALALFQVPGLAVSVVHNGEVVYSKGFGLREINQKDTVDRDTLFQIASVSKAFTTAALAVLVDEGKLGWDDKVIDYLPDFRMYDPWVTREFTLRDLLTHRSGLGLCAGDLLFYPETNTTIDEIIRATRFLKPVSSFRSKFDYDNLLYMIAGEVVARVSGQSHPDFVESHLLAPLGMDGCYASPSRARAVENRATPHVLVGDELQAIGFAEMDLIAAAGGVQCSAAGMARWMQMWLSQTQPTGQNGAAEYTIISQEQIAQMLSPVTLLPGGLMNENVGNHISAYALGWVVSTFYGQPMYIHGGQLSGMTTQMAFLPQANLAVFVSNNLISDAPDALVYDIFDHYLQGGKDWMKIYHDASTSFQQGAEQVVAEAEVARQADSRPRLPMMAYTGTYHDSWYGDIYIEMKDGGLHFRSPRAPLLTGPLEHFQYDTFIARWSDRTLQADAYVSFYLTSEGRVDRIAMKVVSPATDLSYDFHDLDLRYVGKDGAGE